MQSLPGVVGAALAERRLCQLDADPFCEHALSRVAHVGADASLKRVGGLFGRFVVPTLA